MDRSQVFKEEMMWYPFTIPPEYRFIWVSDFSNITVKDTLIFSYNGHDMVWAPLGIETPPIPKKD